MTGRERDRFDRRELVGEGAFGKVYACFDRSDNNKKVGSVER